MFRSILRSILAIVATGLAAPALVSTAFAHHGFAVHYDPTNVVMLDGTIHSVRLQNPHSYIEVSVMEDGEEVIWLCETQARTVIQRRGIDFDLFEVGAALKVSGAKGRNKANTCEILSASFANDQTVVFRNLEAGANVRLQENSQAQTDFPSNIFGTWARVDFRGNGIDENEIIFTEAGLAANAEYDPVTQDPSIFCIAANPLRAWIAPGTPTEIRRNDMSITIRHEFMDAERLVHLNPFALSSPAIAPKDKPAQFGFSLGYFDGDELIVHSIDFPAGVFLTHYRGGGVMNSDKLHLIERYAVSPESGHLVYKWQAMDATYFPAGMSGGFELAQTDAEISEYDCQLEPD